MKKIIRTAGILTLVFAASVAVYFFAARKNMQKEETVYSSMDAPGFPVVYTEFDGKDINALHGYIQDMGNQAAGESISVLPEDRKLNIRVKEYGNGITGLSYEVRNLSMNRLIERTQVEDWQEDGGDIQAILPIQNLLTQNETYLLDLTVSTAEKDIHYYTRIMWADSDHAGDMLRLAEDFTRKSLDYNEAKNLVSYLETNPAEDNSSLGNVSIRASFDHLTWDGLTTELVGEPQITLQVYDGIMGQVQVEYKVRITDSTGAQSLVNAEDNFTMKWNDKRIYLMNYNRYANEAFKGEQKNFAGKRILLGISDAKQIKALKSENSRYILYKVNGNLWRYDQHDKKSMCLFTFSDGANEDVRADYKKHDVKVLSASNEGNVDFLVYGYMNRGTYEGQMGVVFYHYDEDSHMVQEKFFVPVSTGFDQLESDISTLAYLGDNGMTYLLLNGKVAGIDLSSNESVTVAYGLSQGNFAVSTDGSRMAWQEGTDAYHSEILHVMDFNTAQKQDITAPSGDYVRALGFVGSDLIYGFGHESDLWTVNGTIKELPMYAMYIADNEMNIQSEYKKQGIYISSVTAEEGRIHLKRMVKLGENQYAYQDEDTIVCNQKVDADPFEGLGWYASQEKGRVYFVQTDGDVKSSSVKTEAPKAFSYENTSTLELAGRQNNTEDGTLMFYAYGGGRYLGSFRDFGEAVNTAYDKMGYVTDQDQHLVWDRINRKAIRSLKDPAGQARELLSYMDSFGENKLRDSGVMTLDASGSSVNQVLYFIDKGIPAAAVMPDGSYLLLYGYDQYNVSIYDPATQDTYKMGLGDANAYFSGSYNGFLCGLKVE